MNKKSEPVADHYWWHKQYTPVNRRESPPRRRNDAPKETQKDPSITAIRDFILAMVSLHNVGYEITKFQTEKRKRSKDKDKRDEEFERINSEHRLNALRDNIPMVVDTLYYLKVNNIQKIPQAYQTEPLNFIYYLRSLGIPEITSIPSEKKAINELVLKHLETTGVALPQEILELRKNPTFGNLPN
jgi:hypothetical protein